MKIFNWVHRKFNLKDGVAQNAKKTAGIVAEDINDVWKGGILTIGTFGYDRLPKDNEDEQNDHATSYALQEHETGQISALESETDRQITDSEDDDDEEEEEVDDEDEEEEELNPLVYAAYYVHDYEEEMKIEGGNCVSAKDEYGFDEISEKIMKKERTTLAELFSADSKQPINNKAETMMMMMMKKEKPNDHKHKKLSFAKKLIGEDARPIHKLHRLMRRMLKRKVHPDLDLNKHNQANSKVVAKKFEDSASALVPTKDATI